MSGENKEEFGKSQEQQQQQLTGVYDEMECKGGCKNAQLQLYFKNLVWAHVRK